jgi:transcriptional regulator with GAF, ATPase, and Fis domain
LFGREKGAYTGALTRMTGRFEAADGSTLFLDEVGELPLEAQAKLLRVLEDGIFERLGSSKPMKVDVRIIAATNNRLEKRVAEGKFRKDLFYRLNVFPIKLPPLRERPEDMTQLTWLFVKEYESKLGKRVERISQQSLDALQRYAWPGNIRELKNLIERSMITNNGSKLKLHIPVETAADWPHDLTLEETERRYIKNVLQRSNWRVSGRGGAAEILGLKRTTLLTKMKKLGIRRPTA